MLAKELKIKTMKRQREFIKEELENRENCNDGDTSYRYVGNIYPEVVEYFEAEGFTVQKVHSEVLNALTKGTPVYIFLIKEELKLTDEETKQAEEYEVEEDEEESSDGEIEGLLEMLFSGRRPF